MIKVPKYVQTAAESCAKHHRAADRQEHIIDVWVEKQMGEDFVLNDSYRDLVIDCLQQGQGPRRFTRHLEGLIQETVNK